MRVINQKDEKWFIEHCNFIPEDDDPHVFCDGCPLVAECLYYYTGDDSLLPLDSDWRD